jgi:hypothetical protein
MRGSIFDADPPSYGVNFARRNTYWFGVTTRVPSFNRRKITFASHSDFRRRPFGGGLFLRARGRDISAGYTYGLSEVEGLLAVSFENVVSGS